MGKIKVCHVVSGLKAGGVESMIYNYCSRLDKNKYEFHLLYQHEPSQKNIDEFEEIKFKLKRVPSKIKHPLKNYIETLKYLKNNSIDVVHCHMTLMNFIPLIAAKKLKVPIRICHSHNSDVRDKKFFVRIIENLLKKICKKNATHLIACGIDAGKYMYGKKKFVVLNNALDLDKFKFDIKNRKKIRKKYHIKDDEIVIGHIGRFTKQKNHKFIIELFNELNQNSDKYKLILIGDGELKLEVEELVRKYKLDEKVIFTNIIDNTNEYYSAFDIFILPSLWEGLPVVGIEVQVNGVSCIFSDNIDKKVDVTQTVTFLPIDNINAWNDEMQKIFAKKKFLIRKDNIDIIKNANLDINEELVKLEEIYKI